MAALDTGKLRFVLKLAVELFFLWYDQGQLDQPWRNQTWGKKCMVMFHSHLQHESWRAFVSLDKEIWVQNTYILLQAHFIYVLLPLFIATSHVCHYVLMILFCMTKCWPKSLFEVLTSKRTGLGLQPFSVSFFHSCDSCHPHKPLDEHVRHTLFTTYVYEGSAKMAVSQIG